VTALGKARLAARVLARYGAVVVGLRRRPLPELVADLGAPRATRTAVDPPARLRRAVDGVLRIGPWRPRCLPRALVLYRLLREQGVHAELVIGLPSSARDHAAHAWVEIDGRDVGPFPGGRGHRELVRYA
jgi:hypothetical protein